MKKIILAIGLSLCLGAAAFAQEQHYALIEVLIKNDHGPAFLMSTVAKVPDDETCAQILTPINNLKDKYVVRTQCLQGAKWDALFKEIFADHPTDSIYISYKDAAGLETRINSKILTGPHSKLIEPPAQTMVAWANAMLETLEKGGIKNAKIIYPRRSK